MGPPGPYHDGVDLDFPKLWMRYRLPSRGVIHVGAHAGQERIAYSACGLIRQVWIEPQPEVFLRLRAAIPESRDVRLFNVACGDRTGRAVMHRLAGNDGLSNSLLRPTLHLERWPGIHTEGTLEVPVVRLDDLLTQTQLPASGFSLLVLDVQGFELAVLRGADRTLEAIDAVACEIANVPLYENGSTAESLDAHLADRGFTRVLTKWSAGCAGDAFYIRRSLLGAIDRVRLALVGGKQAQPPRSWRSFGAPAPAAAVAAGPGDPHA